MKQRTRTMQRARAAIRLGVSVERQHGSGHVFVEGQAIGTVSPAQWDKLAKLAKLARVNWHTLPIVSAGKHVNEWDVYMDGDKIETFTVKRDGPGKPIQYKPEPRK